MDVAQLVERSLLTLEIRGSNPIIGKVLCTKFSTNCNIEKTEIKTRGQEWPIFKKSHGGGGTVVAAALSQLRGLRSSPACHKV